MSMNTNPVPVSPEDRLPLETASPAAALPAEDLLAGKDVPASRDERPVTDVQASLDPPPANVVSVPVDLLKSPGYAGLLWGSLRLDTGRHTILGWEGHDPKPSLNAEIIGVIGEDEQFVGTQGAALHGTWTDHGLELRLCTPENPRGALLTVEPVDLQRDLFATNATLLDPAFMKKCRVMLSGVGSVGSIVAQQLTRAGVGYIGMADTDCVEIHNICRHQCNLSDLGRYKVDAVGDLLEQINPEIEIRKFYQRIQDVPRAAYEDWIDPERTIFIGTCDNRLGNAAACDLATSFGAPFASLGFHTRCWAGDIFTCLPEKGDICYRCAHRAAIEEDIEEERRNHFYIGEEDLEKGTFEPGMDVDLEFGTSLFTKIVLDILNRKNPDYHPHLYHRMRQALMFSGTDDRTWAEGWAPFFPQPILLRSMSYTDRCRHCEYCLKGRPEAASVPA